MTKSIIYAYCVSCNVHIVIRENEEGELGEWPCIPCPECGSDDVELIWDPKVVILIGDFKFRYGVDDLTEPLHKKKEGNHD